MYMVIYFIIMLLVIFIYSCYLYPNNIRTWMNNIVKYVVKDDNHNLINGISSYRYADDEMYQDNFDIYYFDTLINLNKDIILSEIKNYRSQYKKNNIILLKDKIWSKDSDYFPSIKNINKNFLATSNIDILILNPGDVYLGHNVNYKFNYKYHYCLSVPDNSNGLTIDNYQIKWKHNQGFIWDPTINHTFINETSSPIIILFADISRPLPIGYNLLISIIYSIYSKITNYSSSKNVIKSY